MSNRADLFQDDGEGDPSAISKDGSMVTLDSANLLANVHVELQYD